MKDIREETMHDRIEKMDNCLIQHGKLNDRIYIMEYGSKNPAIILSEIEDLAHEKNYTKIFAKIPASDAPVFLSGGYRMEAFIPRFYNLTEDVFFLSKFMDETRAKPPVSRLLKLSDILDRSTKVVKSHRNEKYSLKQLNQGDAGEITKIYKEVFESYPFPVHDPDYVRKTMEGNFLYFGVYSSGQLVGVASSEVNYDSANAEMTDFAVLPDMRGKRLALMLLAAMEKEMTEKGIQTVYTIARLNSPPMNVTFLKQGYRYGGTLINNTNISGKIESMNVLYKHLTLPSGKKGGLV